MSEPFLKKCLSGDALLEEIDDYIDQWHAGVAKGTALYDYLGMTQEEYRLWVERPATLRVIVAAREEGRSFRDTLALCALSPADRMRVAARAATREEAEEILGWLRSTGRL